MKTKKVVYSLVALNALALSLLAGSEFVSASSLGQPGSVHANGRGETKPVDPEKPAEPVDPGDVAKTEGSLRIDFAPVLNFGQAEITETNRVFKAQAQLFKDATPARGSYVQVTDDRDAKYGWTLQVKQEYQFKNDVIQEANERELVGAVLSLDKGWANSFNPANPPAVTRDTIALDSIGSAYEIATAAKGTGTGTWTVEFGASEDNEDNQDVTLSPLLDNDGKAIIDPDYNKPAYSNSAITLTVPENTKIYPVQYQTELTWIIAELP